MGTHKLLIIISGILLLAIFGVYIFFQRSASDVTTTANLNKITLPGTAATNASNSNVNSENANVATNIAVSPVALNPINRAQERITKKPFGMYITPKTSPIQPERFSGYHTGVDFEIMPDELNATIQVRVFCDGKLIYKKWVNGYGGVAIQSCAINSQDVTVLYGHLHIDSISNKVGDMVTKGSVLGNLGDAYSQQTDNERKHLHFSIHKGSAIELKGYVQKQSELASWLDPLPIISP